MKWKSLTTATVIVLLFVAGCPLSKVQMSPEYQQQVEMSAAVVNELEQRCNDGNDIEACKQGLTEASKTLNLIVDAIHGVGSTGGDD